jgi:glycosyltransferase involved in cell wall biosynthesis
LTTDSGSAPAEPLVSVIMSTYDNAAYIEAAIASLIAQTHRNWELIVIDDCSTDGTAAILERLVESDDRISVRRTETNQGYSRNRNLAIPTARGKYVTFLDSDDEREPTSLEQQAGFLEANPEVVLVGTGCQWCDENLVRLNDRLYPLTDAEIRKRILRYSAFCIPSMMMRVAVLDDPVFDVDLYPADDIDLPLRLGLKGKLANLPDPLYRIRSHPKSTTQAKIRAMEKKTFEVRRKAVREYGYRATPVDIGWNAAQWATMHVMPGSWRFSLFNRMRAAR